MIQMQKEIKTLQEGKEEFIVNCKVKNLSTVTIRSYEECFDYFIKYMEGTFNNINVKEDVNKNTIDNYIIYMQKCNLKDTTINIRLRSIRCVLDKHRKNIKTADYILEDTPKVKEVIKIEMQMKNGQENITRIIAFDKYKIKYYFQNFCKLFDFSTYFEYNKYRKQGATKCGTIK